MTLFEFLVPLAALAVAAAGTLMLRREARVLDDQSRHQRRK